MDRWPSLLQRLRQEDGATLVEYALILTAISLVVIGVLPLLGTFVIAAFTSASAGF